jgi:hypothetical protein
MHRIASGEIGGLSTCCRASSPEDWEPVFAMMSKLTIDRLGGRGEGVAQGPDGSIFVPYALAGETILAEVDGSRGKLAEVLTPSPHRIAPFCCYFSRCGGCAVQTLAADSYARWKRETGSLAQGHRILRSAQAQAGLVSVVGFLLWTRMIAVAGSSSAHLKLGCEVRFSLPCRGCGKTAGL